MTYFENMAAENGYTKEESLYLFEYECNEADIKISLF